jgi:ribosome recycling factor
MDPDEVMLECEDKMEKTITFLKDEYRTIRTGRASTGLVENIKVEYYGSPTPLKQLAGVAVPEARLIVIKPYDRTSLGEIERAILKSELGITPQSDGKVIRLAVPPLSEENRKKLAHQVKDMAEQQRISLRSIRHGAIKQMEEMEDAGKITEDDLHKYKEEIQEFLKKYEEEIGKVLKAKTDEIMEV